MFLRKRWLSSLAALAGFVTVASAHATDSRNCSNNSEPWTYHAQPGDLSTSTRLDVQRPARELRSLRFEACSGDIRVLPAPAGTGLHLVITTPGADKPLGDFLQTMSIDNDQAVVRLQIPKTAHADITLYVPEENKRSVSEINLGEGVVRLEGHAVHGERKLNIGAGSAYVILNGSLDYAHLQTNIGMGRLVDSRPGGHGGLLVVSRSTSGTGEGTLEINVGAGTIHLLPKEGH